MPYGTTSHKMKNLRRLDDADSGAGEDVAGDVAEIDDEVDVMLRRKEETLAFKSI